MELLQGLYKGEKMALQKNKTTRFDIVGNYHRIINIDIKAKINRVYIVVDLYKDKAARDANKAPLESQTIEIKDAAYLAMANAVTSGQSFFAEVATACYNHLKTLPAFADSLDV